MILILIFTSQNQTVVMWFKTHETHKYYPFLDYQVLLDKSLLDIRQEFALLALMK
ncbi:MAG: hypothetical protein KME60_09460 [Cyanomargarita calcarea GSE-NOS-MK-12-04C]|jgi:hypothetical protein|uniref:Uncharacterized protein n=1 Tax=Cyanomargarita calcarea GSE-NOS-MK-12-04C TaxID=2839659 RepID=A0A951QN74_9CYAN|nr:hypothetical protein [Cyanomargarita calcarea GSE-NOS-MK-12-04C]